MLLVNLGLFFYLCHEHSDLQDVPLMSQVCGSEASGLPCVLCHWPVSGLVQASLAEFSSWGLEGWVPFFLGSGSHS